MCKQCEINPVYEFTNKRKLCGNCFVNWFNKKFLYTIRKFKMIQRGDIVAYKKSDNLKDVVLEKLLEMFSNKSNIQLVKYPNKKANKIALNSTIDSEAQEIVHKLINDSLEKLTFSPTKEKKIKPLYLFLDKEVLLYAKLNKLKFKTEKKQSNQTSSFISKLEKKHPEVKRAIVNGFTNNLFVSM